MLSIRDLGTIQAITLQAQLGTWHIFYPEGGLCLICPDFLGITLNTILKGLALFPKHWWTQLQVILRTLKFPPITAILGDQPLRQMKIAWVGFQTGIQRRKGISSPIGQA